MGKLKADFYGSKLPVSLDLPTFVDKSGLGNDWFEKANCKGKNPELFHPGSKNSYLAKIARELCSQCVVVDECLEYAISNNIHHGIYGGLNHKERQRLNGVRIRQRLNSKNAK